LLVCTWANCGNSSFPQVPTVSVAPHTGDQYSVETVSSYTYDALSYEILYHYTFTCTLSASS
jgi:hypothetical protein